MAKKEPAEYKAMISDEGGVIRGRIPSPLVRDLGAKPGDYLVFNHDGKGNVAVKLAKGKAAGKAAKKPAAKVATKKKR